LVTAGIGVGILFGFDYEAIEIVCHPQSVIHCLVEYADGSWKSSLAPPDMRVPIAYALGFPQRPEWGAERVDWARMPSLHFEPVDTGTFRCVALAYEAGRTGGTAPAVLNAANEVAVAAFLDGRGGFLDIADAVERTVHEGASAGIGYGREDIDLDDVVRADAWARMRAQVLVRR
jgi:1-deoxy-D-xylulose-5-phosphate reductoisomerase